MIHCSFGEFSDPTAEEDGRACKQECTATRLNDPHPRGTEFQYMSLSCCMHSDTQPEGPQAVCQNQYPKVRVCKVYGSGGYGTSSVKCKNLLLVY